MPVTVLPTDTPRAFKVVGSVTTALLVIKFLVSKIRNERVASVWELNKQKRRKIVSVK